MSEGRYFRMRVALMRASPAMVALFAAGLFLVLYAVFLHFEAFESLQRWLEGFEHHRDLDEIVFAGFVTLLLLTSLGYWVTHRGRAELAQSSELLQIALDSMAGGVALFDKNERLALYNRGLAANLANFPAALRPGISFVDFVKAIAAGGGYADASPDWINERIRKFRALEPIELHRTDPDGSEHWHLVRHYRTRNGGTLRVGANITERKRMEAALESSQRLLQVALDSMTDGAALYDKNERLVLCNKGYARNLSIIGDVLKPGVSVTDEVAALMERGGYIGAGENWIRERLRKFRALEPSESRQRDANGNERWISSRHYRTGDGGTFLVRADVTDLKRATMELESSRDLLQTALESLKDGVALFDKDERLALWNEGFVRTSPGLRDIVAPGISFADMVAHMTANGRYLDVGEDWVETRVRQFRALEPVENHMRDSDGSERWAEIHLYRTSDGGTFMVRTDITARKRAEIDLNSTRQLLRTALESISDGVALFDKDERLTLWNEGFVTISPGLRAIARSGITFTDFISRMSEDHIYLDVGENWIETRLRQFHNLEPVEVHLRHPDGGDRWYYVRLYRTGDGGTFLVRTDITARKRAEEQLKSTQGLLLTALETMNDGFALFDRAERLVLYNQEFLKFPAIIRDVARIGIPFVDLVETLFARGAFVGKDRAWLDERIRRFRDLTPVEDIFRDADGGERWFSYTHHRARDGGTLLIREDVTERVRALGEIDQARAIAETANDAKTKFLASMSHELRTPLNAILGFAQMMELGVGRMPEAQVREYLAIILKSGQHLLDLVSHILEFAKTENEGDQKTFIALSSVELAGQCLDMIREEARVRDVVLVNRIGEDGADIRFLGDKVWARQILLNLLVNAVKYNRRGGTTTLSCARRANGMVRFAVADTGVGIELEMHGRLFQPFQRLGREAGQVEGAGIGLALSRHLVLRMGGTIGFASEPGQGSTFWFELPAVHDEPGRAP